MKAANENKSKLKTHKGKYRQQIQTFAVLKQYDDFSQLEA